MEKAMQCKFIKLGTVIFLSLLLLSGCGASEETKAQKAGFPDVKTYREASNLNFATFEEYRLFLQSKAKEAQKKKKQEQQRELQIEDSKEFLMIWADKIDEGKLIVAHLLAKEGTSIGMPVAFDDMLLRFFVNDADWDKLQQSQKEAVCLYIKSLIPIARQQPEKYASIPPHSPLYKKYISAARNMGYDCWEVVANGTLGGLVEGDEIYSRRVDKKGLSFSAFSSNKYSTAKFQNYDTRGTDELAEIALTLSDSEVASLTNAAQSYIKKKYPNSSNYNIIRLDWFTEGVLIKIRFDNQGTAMYGEITLDEKPKNGTHTIIKEYFRQRP